jgi:hypothetical protein
LLPRHGVELFAPSGGGERFAGLFKEVWRAIPIGPRRSILKHWRKGLFGRPAIELLDDWSTSEYRRTDGFREYVRSYAQVLNNGVGCQIRFRRKAVAKMPDDVVRAMIAHELAHCYQEGFGWDLAKDIEDDPLSARFFFEEYADDCAAEWGFDVNSLAQWVATHYVSGRQRKAM